MEATRHNVQCNVLHINDPSIVKEAFQPADLPTCQPAIETHPLIKWCYIHGRTRDVLVLYAILPSATGSIQCHPCAPCIMH